MSLYRRYSLNWQVRLRLSVDTPPSPTSSVLDSIIQKHFQNNHPVSLRCYPILFTRRVRVVIICIILQGANSSTILFFFFSLFLFSLMLCLLRCQYFNFMNNKQVQEWEGSLQVKSVNYTFRNYHKKAKTEYMISSIANFIRYATYPTHYFPNSTWLVSIKRMISFLISKTFLCKLQISSSILGHAILIRTSTFTLLRPGVATKLFGTTIFQLKRQTEAETKINNKKHRSFKVFVWR